MDLQTGEPTTPPQKRSWFWRNLIAVAAMVLIIVIVGALLTVHIPKGNEGAISTALWTLTGIVFAFFGNSAATENIAQGSWKK